MKDFHCREAGLDCDWVARGHSDEEVVEQLSHHALQVHDVKLDADLLAKVRGHIHDLSSSSHRESMGGVLP